jgi:hypothetical protein
MATTKYPKSSCNTCKCSTKDNFDIPIGSPSNMSVPGCNFSDYYNCYPKRVFKIQETPNNKEGNYLINKSLLKNIKYDPTFKPINAKDCPRSNCSGTTWLASDPRLYNAVSSQWMQLDSPPIESTPKLNTLITNKDLDKYGQRYRSYKDVDAGYIKYYIDRDIEDAFFKPNFPTEGTSVGVMYQDPMGSMKPQYDLIPLKSFGNPLTDDKCDVAGDYGLSFMKDTQFHREDLNSRQMRVINQQRYSPRWTGQGFV